MKNESANGRHITAAFAIAVLVVGCTSVSSRVEDSSSATDDGVIYFMPKRVIKITVSVDQSGTQTASVDPGDTIPDLSRSFVLDYTKNWVGKNHLVMTVSSAGLLQSANSDTVSGVITIAKNLATAAGDITGAGLAGPGPSGQVVTPPRSSCSPGQKYVELYMPGSGLPPHALCNYQVAVNLLGPVAAVRRDTPRLGDKHVGQSGLFYKHDLPYLVTLTDFQGAKSEYMALSPNESEIGFVPVTRTLLANNTGNITLSNGIVTGVDQTSDGELVAASELPADILSAYFSAIGSIFSQFSTNAKNQSDLITNQQALSVVQAKQKACAAAIADNPIAGKSAADAQTAITAIKTACSSG